MAYRTKAQEREWQRKDRLRHPEKYRARERKYHSANHKRRAVMRKASHDRHPEQRRRWALKKNYDLTPEQWASIFEAQGRCCAICKTPIPNGNKRKDGTATWATDHDHKTGKVRGILCNNCNHGLGNFKDNKTLLRLATEYLDSSEN